jgi:hypothetical protein
MTRPGPEPIVALARQRIARIQEQIRALDDLASGTLARRTKLCGRPGCRCARDQGARHGPYYEWGRMKNGRLVNRMVSPQEASLIRRAIANYRAVRRLLRAWENQTVRVIEAQKPRK